MTSCTFGGDAPVRACRCEPCRLARVNAVRDEYGRPPIVSLPAYADVSIADRSGYPGAGVIRCLACDRPVRDHSLSARCGGVA